MLVLLANEPRMYREAFAVSFAAARPNVETITVKPGALDREALRLRPDLVVCNRATPTVKAVARSWIELRVNNGMLIANSNVVTLPADKDVEFRELLSIIDRTEKRLHWKSLRQGKAGPVR